MRYLQPECSARLNTFPKEWITLNIRLIMPFISSLWQCLEAETKADASHFGPQNEYFIRTVWGALELDGVPAQPVFVSGIEHTSELGKGFSSITYRKVSLYIHLKNKPVIDYNFYVN